MLKLTRLKRVVLLCIPMVLAAVVSGRAQTSGGPFVVTVTVSDTTGAPEGNVTVMFIDTSNSMIQATTSAAGTFSLSLPAGPYTVRIVASGYPVQYLNYPINSISPGFWFGIWRDTGMAITLTPSPMNNSGTTSGIVTGTVLDSVGNPVIGAKLTLVRMGSNIRSDSTVTSADGNFSFTVQAIAYRLQVSAALYPVQYWTPAGLTTIDSLNNTALQVMPNTTISAGTIRLSMHPATSGSPDTMTHVVHVRVIDSTGASAPGTMVRFMDLSNAIVNQGMTTAPADLPITVPGGIYRVELSNPAYPVQFYNVPINSIAPSGRIVITSDTVLVFILTMTPTQTTTTQYGIVSGFVLDSVGKPVMSATILLKQLSTSTVVGRTITDSMGHFIDTVQPTLCRLQVLAPLYPAQYWTSSGLTTTDSLNNTTLQVASNGSVNNIGIIKLSMHPATNGSAGTTTHVVEVRVIDSTGAPAPGTTVMFIDTTKYVRQGITGTTGEMPMSLPAGVYQVELSHPAYPVQYFGVPINSTAPTGRIVVSNDTMLTFALTQTPMKIGSNYGDVSGVVLDSAGKGVRNAKVTLTQVGTNIVSAGMMTDSAGRFFASVQAMPHRILAYAPLYPAQYWTSTGLTTTDSLNNTALPVMANDTSRVIIRLSTHPGSGSVVYIPPSTRNNGFVTGHVFVKATNQPAAGLFVYAVPRDTTIPNSKLFVNMFGSPYFDTVKADGSYRISGLPGGWCWIYTRGNAYIPQFYPQTDYPDSCAAVWVDSTGKSGIDFSVRTGGVIVGQLSCAGSANLDTITVFANLFNGSLQQSSVTAHGGRFTLSGLVSGSWDLSIDVSRGYSMDYSSGKSSKATVVEGKTDSGVVLYVTRGGVIAGTVTPPFSADSLYTMSQFAIALFSDSVLKSSNQFPWEGQTIWANMGSQNMYFSGAIPAGAYKIMFQPNAPAIPRDTTRWVKCRSFSMGGTGPVPSLLQAPTFKVIAGDTNNVPARFGPGFSFLGPFRLEDNSRPNWARVDACIKDGNDYIAVCHGYVTTGDTMFQLTGLLDESDYYLRCDADGYPTQWWSPGGSMSSAPATPYRFSSLNFARPSVKMVKVPSGYYNNYTPFWVNTVFDSASDRLTVQWNIDASISVDTFILYSKDRSGVLSVLTQTSFKSGQTRYSWLETRDLGSNQYSYVVVGKAAQYSVRTSSAGYDINTVPRIARDSLLLMVFGNRYGVAMNWSAGKDYVPAGLDSIIVYRATGQSAVWTRLFSQPGGSTYLSDNQWDKSADLGKTFSYRLELVSGTTTIKRSPARSFTIDAAFVNQLSNHFSVGPNEQYTKIQDAVDNARDNDQITVEPGTYVENVNLKGKILEIDGDWRNGLPPVLDGNGGTAITVPHSSTGGSWTSVNINGLKIQNALVAVSASTDVSVNHCLFVNVVKQVMTAVIDSANMVRAARMDPFNQYTVNLNAWQCTFIGGSGSGTIAHIGSQGVYESQSSSAAANPCMLSPATSFNSGINVNNSILSGFPMTTVPVDMYGSRGNAWFANCDFVNTSTAVPSTYANQIQLNRGIFNVPPQFKDSVYYFLPDSSPLRTMADNGNSIGYDAQRFSNSNDNNNNGGPRPGPVRNFHFAIAGPHAVKLTWSGLAADQNAVAYVVYRMYGYDSLWSVSQGQWSPKVSQNDMFSILDTFMTRDTAYLDTTPRVNVPYVYVVAGVTATGNTGEVDLPFPPPLSAYTVRLAPLSAMTGMRATALSFSAASFSWPSPDKGAVYSVYKIGLNSANSPDSAALRAIIKTRAFASIDSFTTRDSAFIDSSLVFGKPYCFVVTSFDSAGMRLPLWQMPYSFSYVMISMAAFSNAARVPCLGQAWSMVGPWGTNTLSFANATTSDIYHWDDLKQSDKLYSQYAPASAMKPGEGYWFMPAADTILSIDTSAVGAALLSADVQTVNVFKGTTGWNQVASTLPYPVSPSWLVAGFTPYEWNADSNQYEQALALKPWKGYWIFSSVDTALPLAGLPVRGSLAKKTVLGAYWQFRVLLTGKKSRDPDNYCGVVPLPLARTMRLASPKPPQAFNYPQLFFVAQGAEGAAGEGQRTFARLYKSASSASSRQEWTVGISPSAEDMTVSVAGIASVPQKDYVFLVENGTVYDLRKKSSVVVPAHKETAYGYLVATSDVREMALYSGIVELRKAYPNPFRNNVSIEFTLPYSFGSDGAKLEGEYRNISLEIFSIQGRRVATLVSGNQHVGYYRKVWSGASDAGSPVSSGVYIVRFAGRNFQKTSTLFKLR